MFTSLNNILGLNQPRHAEHSDTRQDIQRHDPEFERRKKKKEESPEDLLAGEDGATLSITALQAFLNNFLKELNDKKPSAGFNETSHAPTQDTNPAAEIIDTPKQPISGHAAYAANSYKHMSESQSRTSILGEVNEHNADLISLDAAEVRTIHTILEDLKKLHNKNIEYIHIERSTSFLQSLVNAVETLKKSDLFNA